MTWPIATIMLEREEDIVTARRHARRIAADLGFELRDQTRIAATVSEIARNAVAYAGRGEAGFDVSETDGRQTLTIIVRDNGGGIAELSKVLSGRYVSRTGMGQGIPIARRLMDRFAIASGPQGTTVTLEKTLPRRAAPVTRATVQALSRSIPPERADPLRELQTQNQELMQSMGELITRSEELEQLAQELESTNRGVVALHSELEATAQELRNASDLKSRFLSNISHEFRTPLNSVIALSRLLLARTDGELTEEQEKQVRFIADAAQGLTGLVNDLLDIAKVEAGKVDIRLSEFTLADLFGALRGLLRPLRTSDAVDLVFDDPERVPPMLSDEGKLTQILRNLIVNALKFTECGEVRVASEFREPDRVLLIVRDTGIGIPSEYHNRIFEEFEQVPGLLQIQAKGTGLGLPLSRKLAELLGGTIAVDSEPGHGSTFLVNLPLRHGSAVSAADKPVEVEKDKACVLIVDDEETFRYVVRRMIDVRKYATLEAANGDEGLAMARSVRPDVIILDLSMPRRDGYSTLEELGRDPVTREIPVIISSSLVLSERDRGRLARSRAIISKENISADLLGGILTDVLRPRSDAP